MSIQKTTRSVDFVINRISRLYPTYWAVVTFTFVLLIATSSYGGEVTLWQLFFRYVGNLTMFQFYLRVDNLDGPYWTLIIEMLFYISMLVLFEKKWLKFLNVIGIVLCSFVVLLTHFFNDISCLILIMKAVPLLQFLPLFFAGTTFHKIYTHKENLIHNYLIVFFCFFCQISLFPYVGYSKNIISGIEYSTMLFSYFMLFVLFINNSLTFIANKTTLFFGKISYALYLIHQYISLELIIPFFYKNLGLNFWIVTFFIDLPTVIGIATLITYKVEVPFSKKMKEKLYQFANQSSYK